MNTELENIELSIEQARLSVNTRAALNTLTDDKNFKKVVTEGYFKDEASRLVLLKADPSMQTPAHQNTLEKSIDAIGYFRLYLSTIYQLGAMAEKAMIEDEATRDELEAEEAVN